MLKLLLLGRKKSLLTQDRAVKTQIPNYSFELTYIPSVEVILKEIQTDASLFMGLDNVRFCEGVSLLFAVAKGFKRFSVGSGTDVR